ncbi:hypothetical protein [Leucobacter chromiireducens]|uniref:hypothetical protein n=1 Tax=Leucobacter chromiireducens TaxID=283877 RepID=UPI000F64005D|nr:hypothetical protein [Leucobacter chromiireducens]
MTTASRTPEGHAPEDWNATTPLPGTVPAAEPGTAGSREARARTFVAAVRSQLADLGQDEVDELTDGLAADLTDRLGEDPALGDPVKYAAELRQAAGLPQRSGQAGQRPSLAERSAAWSAGWQAWWEATPARVAVRDFAGALRPLWWLARGAALAAVVCLFAGIPIRSLLWAGLAVAAVIVSVQWGRGRWAPAGWGVWLRRLASAVAVFAIVVLTPTAIDVLRGASGGAAEAPEYQQSFGLTTDGAEIFNIFAYDCAGQPLDGVQLFTQDGTPLHTGSGSPAESGWMPTSGYDPETGEYLEYRRNAVTAMPDEWNVFPLREAREVAAMPLDASAPGDAPTLPYERVTGLGNCDAEAATPETSDTAKPETSNTAKPETAD